MRPEENPLGNLAAALAGPQGRIDPTRILEIRRLLNRGADAPAAVAKYLGCDAENNVCVLFDQFEELFEHARRGGGTEAMLITDFLVGLAANRPKGLHAILTMRSDYLGQCAQYRGFAEAVNETQYLVPRMERPALMRAIREPAALYGGSVDAGPRRAADRRRRRRPGPAAADPARADADVAQGGSGGCAADADAAGLPGRRRSCRATVPPRRRDDGRGDRRAGRGGDRRDAVPGADRPQPGGPGDPPAAALRRTGRRDRSAARNACPHHRPLPGRRRVLPAAVRQRAARRRRRHRHQPRGLHPQLAPHIRSGNRLARPRGRGWADLDLAQDRRGGLRQEPRSAAVARRGGRAGAVAQGAQCGLGGAPWRRLGRGLEPDRGERTGRARRDAAAAHDLLRRDRRGRHLRGAGDLRGLAGFRGHETG